MAIETILERNGDADTCEDCSERCGRCARKCQIDFYYDEYGKLVHPDWGEPEIYDYDDPRRNIDYNDDVDDDDDDNNSEDDDESWMHDNDDEWWANDPDMVHDIE